MSQEITVDFLGQEINVTLDAGALTVFSDDSSAIVVNLQSQIDSATSQAASADANAANALAGLPGKADTDLANVLAKSGRVVSVADFGAVGNGTTNDTPAIQAAIDSLGAAGGSVIIPRNFRCLVDTNLTLKKSVSLVGPHEMVGSPGNNASAPYGSIGGTLIINSAVTITMQSGSTVKGLLVHRKGMTFPAASAAAFAGTALTNDGDDVAVLNCMFLGFDQAFVSSAVYALNRIRIYNVNMDCQGGILIDNCLDNPYVAFCHSWPFATIAASVGSSIWFQRSKASYKFTNVADWLNLVNCFSYAHAVGIELVNVNSYVLSSPMCDGPSVFGISAGTWNASTNTPTLASGTISPASGNDYPYYTVSVAGSTTLDGNTGWALGEKAFFVNGAWTKVPIETTPIANLNTGSIGILIDGTTGGCEHGQIVTPRVASQEVAGIRSNVLFGVTTNIIGGTVWACGKNAINHVEGNLTVNGTLLQNCAVGIKVDTTTGQSNRIGVSYDNIGQPVLATVSTDNIYGTQDISNRTPGGAIVTDNGNAICETIASAAAIGLPMNGQLFNITGTTSFGTIGPGWKDREITLIFGGSLTVFAGLGTSTSILLRGGLNFAASVGNTLTLRHNGVQWYEVARSGLFAPPATATIASADPLPVPATGEAFNVTGTTNCGQIAGGSDGRLVTLFFAGVLTIFSATGSSANVRLNGGNFTTSAGGTLTIRHNGTQWYEIGRSA